MKENTPFQFMPSKWIIFVILLLMLIILLIIPSSIISLWPYLLLAIGLIITLTIAEYDKKWAIISVAITMLFIFGALFWFYQVLPIEGNYHPIIIPGKAEIFSIDGKFSIGYYPDYPIPSDTITLTVDICNIDRSVCTKCENCTLSGYFFNEENRKQYLFENRSLKNEYNVRFSYIGQPTEITMRYGDEPREYLFRIPKPSIYQAIVLALNENPILGSIQLILSFSPVVGIGAVIIKRRKIIECLRKRKPKKLDYAS